MLILSTFPTFSWGHTGLSRAQWLEIKPNKKFDPNSGHSYIVETTQQRIVFKIQFLEITNICLTELLYFHKEWQWFCICDLSITLFPIYKVLQNLFQSAIIKKSMVSINESKKLLVSSCVFQPLINDLASLQIFMSSRTHSSVISNSDLFPKKRKKYILTCFCGLVCE